jgi:hypothetical protein
VSNRNLPRLQLAEAPRYLDRIAPELHLHGQNVGGARRQDSKRHAAADHAFHGLIDGSIATRDDDQIGAACNVLARDRTRRARARGGRRRNTMALLFECFRGPAD